MTKKEPIDIAAVAMDERYIDKAKSFAGERGGLNVYRPLGTRLTFEIEVPGSETFVVLPRAEVVRLAATLDQWLTATPF